MCVCVYVCQYVCAVCACCRQRIPLSVCASQQGGDLTVEGFSPTSPQGWSRMMTALKDNNVSWHTTVSSMCMWTWMI